MNTALEERLFQSIERHDKRSIAFAEFMRVCLYEPGHGYYTNPAERRLGREGDFFTSVSVGEGFGFFLGLAAESRWQKRRSSVSAPFLIVEQGAHDGQLALDLLAGLDERKSGLESVVSYVIYEPDPDRARALASRALDQRITVATALPETPAICGLYLCNELLDAFPVHRIRWEKGRWRQCRVAMSESEGERRLEQMTIPVPAGSDLEEAIETIEPREWPEGYTTEVCLELKAWMESAVRWFDRGDWWIIDYGREASDYYAPTRHEGTLRCYRKHQRVDDPLAMPGEVDLTADVNFSEVDRLAEAQGLTRDEFTDQHHFLIRAAASWLQEIEASGPEALEQHRKRLRQFQTLTHPGLMGRAFKVASYRRD